MWPFKWLFLSFDALYFSCELLCLCTRFIKHFCSAQAIFCGCCYLVVFPMLLLLLLSFINVGHSAVDSWYIYYINIKHNIFQFSVKHTESHRTEKFKFNSAFIFTVYINNKNNNLMLWTLFVSFIFPFSSDTNGIILFSSMNAMDIIMLVVSIRAIFWCKP